MQNLRFQDMLWRSVGTLKSARVMSYDEFMEALSIARIGVAAGEIALPMTELNQLIFRMQPANLNAANGKHLDRQARDAQRAEKIREIFNGADHS